METIWADLQVGSEVEEVAVLSRCTSLKMIVNDKRIIKKLKTVQNKIHSHILSRMVGVKLEQDEM